MENEQRESIQLKDEGEKDPTSAKTNHAGTFVKLMVLLGVGYAAMQYGVPLMNQFSEDSRAALEDLEKEDNTEVDAESGKEGMVSVDAPSVVKAEAIPTEIATPGNPSHEVRITKGYEGWKDAVTEQLEDWVELGVKHQLMSIDVNDSNDTMEIRYRERDQDGFTTRKKLILKKDGFGDRFILVEGEKEFLLVPPH